MKVHTVLALLAIFAANVQSEDDFEKHLKEADTTPKTALLFHQLVQKPGELTLTITDEAKLGHAIATLEAVAKRIDIVVEHLAMLPKPSEAERAEITKAAEALESESKNALEVKLREHVSAMKPEMRAKWMPAMKQFYQGLDKHTKVLAAYFSASEK